MFPAPGSVPRSLVTETFRLEPLGPEHNDPDHAAWSSSIDHIRATPGFTPDDASGDSWPYPMDADANLADLERHAQEFVAGVAYAFTVLDPGTADVIGCLYVNPDPGPDVDSVARLWVRADHAELDRHLEASVRSWIAESWPAMTVRFPGRDRLGPPEA